MDDQDGSAGSIRPGLGAVNMTNAGRVAAQYRKNLE
jgi:hypothetical protein